MDCEVPLVEKPTHHRRGWRRRPPLAVPVPTRVGSPSAVLLTGLGSGEVQSACKGIAVLQSITVLASVPSAYYNTVDSTGSTVGLLRVYCEDSQALSIDKTQRGQSQRQRIAIRIDRL